VSAAIPSFEYRLLGSLEVRVDGRPVQIKGAKDRALLAILLLGANRPQSSDHLIRELWGDGAPRSARNSLQVRISNLRKALARPEAGDEPVVSVEHGYLVRLEPNQLDLYRFEHLLAAAGEAITLHETAQASEMLSEALALWRGPALADFVYEPFAQIPAARLDELRLLAIEMRTDTELALGRHAMLIPELETIVAQHPFRERLCGQLMLALYRGGRQTEALATYRRIRRKLSDELGIEPNPILQQLQKAILRQDPTLDLAAVPAPDRSILIAVLNTPALDSLVVLGRTLATRPRHELIVLQPNPASGDVTQASALLNERREELASSGIVSRTAAFTAKKLGDELIRVAIEQDVDLLLVDGSPDVTDNEVIRELLEGSPCDVAILVARNRSPVTGPVLVPFGGGDHDWSAVELGAWISTAWHMPLRLVGAAAGDAMRSNDASRLLATAALAAQQALGVRTEPVLIRPTAEALVRATEEAALVVIGLPQQWRHAGLGRARTEVARHAQPTVVIVRRGTRPGGLAPRGSHTKFTWSLESDIPQPKNSLS
jgi:DNA-binding SARP family transcriptional activator